MMMKYAWLIENGKAGDHIRYRAWKNEFPRWVKDPYEALWFVRRKDAEAIAEGDPDAWAIAEHEFEEEED